MREREREREWCKDGFVKWCEDFRVSPSHKGRMAFVIFAKKMCRSENVDAF